MESNGHQYPTPNGVRSYAARVDAYTWASVVQTPGCNVYLCGLRFYARGYLLLFHSRAANLGSDVVFVLQGVCLVIEVEVKKAVTGRWRLHPVVSGALTLVFLAVTGNWLFFPQLLRNGVDTKGIAEYAIMVDFVKAKLP
ncbi:hypothetical protein M0R45_005707 [Rubus argutus]|uniref:Uncharacterized protein n=1 Tax=Rubus argutus TaxID=59490 RepID=A0AAW1YNK3_RUBAR